MEVSPQWRIKKMYAEKTIKWFQKGSEASSQPIPLTMSFMYRWTDGYVERKEP